MKAPVYKAPVVTGLELDFDGADIKSSDTFGPFGSLGRTVKFDELATARGRLGYVVVPDLLFYGTAGAACGHSTLSRSEIPIVPAPANGPPPPRSRPGDASVANFGWVAGAGLEYHLWHGFIARAEYLHYDFAKTTYSLPAPFGPGNASTTIDVVRGGLSHKF